MHPGLPLCALLALTTACTETTREQATPSSVLAKKPLVERAQPTPSVPAKEEPPVPAKDEGAQFGPVGDGQPVRLPPGQWTLHPLRGAEEFPEPSGPPPPCKIPDLPEPIPIIEIPWGSRNSVAANDKYVYVAIAPPPQCEVLQIDIKTGKRRTIGKKGLLPSRLRLHEDMVFWMVHGAGPPHFHGAPEDGEAYRLLRYDRRHGKRTLYEGEIASDVLEYHDGRLYWIHPRDLALRSVSAKGGDLKTLARWSRSVDAEGRERGVTKTLGLGMHEGRVYWAVRDWGGPVALKWPTLEAVMSVGLDGSDPRVDHAFVRALWTVHFEDGLMVADIHAHEFVGLATATLPGDELVAVTRARLGAGLGDWLEIDGEWAYGAMLDESSERRGEALVRVPLAGGDPCVVYRAPASLRDARIENGRAVWIETPYGVEPMISTVKMLVIPEERK